MNKINKGFVKVEKFEAIQDEEGNWVPFGEVLETVEKQNALSIAILRRMTAQDDNRAGAFMGRDTTNFASSSGDLSQPGDYYPQIFISEFPTSAHGSLPGYRSNASETSRAYPPNKDGFGLYIGTIKEINYDDRDSDESKTIITVRHRFNPDPTRDRSIRAIGFCNITSLNLGSVFTQTSSQILDVTYTIEIDLSEIQNTVFSRREKMQRKQLSYPAGHYDNDYLLPMRTSILPQSELKEGVAQGFPIELHNNQYTTGTDKLPDHDPSLLNSTYAFEDPDGYLYKNLINHLDGIYAPTNPTINYTVATEKVGMLLGSVVSVQDDERATNIHEWHCSKGSTSRKTTNPNTYFFHSQQSVNSSSTGSAIQNTFPRNSISALPYQDVDALATGSGTIRISDSDVSGGSSWTANEDGLAKKYRIKITTGGPTGTAEYTVERRNWAGTAGNQNHLKTAPMLYANMQNSTTDSDGRGKKVIPFANDVAYDYHGQYPSFTSTNGSFDNNIVSARKMYKYPEFITYDRTGFTIMHMNQPGQNFTSNFSDICQLVVHQNPAKDIYVADISTGLWKIERTVGQSESESTVTRLTASNAADDTECRGVQVKNDGQIWAIFGEEMCSSSDGGSTWTVYNGTTGTQFKLGSHMDTANMASTPERISGFTMDRYNAEDRFLIPLKDASNLSHDDYTEYFYWWSRAGSSTGTSDGLYKNTSGTYLNHSLRSGDDAIWCSKGGLWYGAPTGPSGYMHVANFRNSSWRRQGYAWSSTYKTPMFGTKAHWWQEDGGEEYVLGATYTGTNTPLVAVRSDRFDSSDNTANYSFFGGSLSGTGNNPHEAKRLTDGFYDGTDYTFYGTTNSTVFNLLGLIDPGTAIIPYAGAFLAGSLTGSITDSDGSPKVGDWTSYGWDGSNWVAGSTTPKTTHASRDSLIDGLTVKFDGSDAGSWVTTEYYDTYAYNGILKDNATSFSLTLNRSYLDVDTTTDFESTVPTHTASTVTEPVYLGWVQSTDDFNSQDITVWAEQGNWITNTSDTNLSYSTMMRSEQAMQGDLSITFKLAEMNLYTTQAYGGRIGLASLHPSPQTTFKSTATFHSDWMWFKYGGRPNTTDSAGDLTISFHQGSSSHQNDVVLTDYDPSDVFKVERSNGNVVWYRNSVAIHTSNIVGDNEKVNFFMHKDEYGAGNFMLRDITATYVDSDGPCVTVGNGSTTGASNADFRKVVENSTTRDEYNEIFIDGVPATINYDNSLPAAGACTILPHSGKIRFDPSDAGATITGKVGYLKKF
jgi:hypothetical protein